MDGNKDLYQWWWHSSSLLFNLKIQSQHIEGIDPSHYIPWYQRWQHHQACPYQELSWKTLTKCAHLQKSMQLAADKHTPNPIPIRVNEHKLLDFLFLANISESHMFKPMGALCENFSLVMTNNEDVSCCSCGFDMYLVHRNHANYVRFLEWSWSIQAIVSRSYLNSHLNTNDTLYACLWTFQEKMQYWMGDNQRFKPKQGTKQWSSPSIMTKHWGLTAL